MRANSPEHLAHGQADKWDTTGVLLDEAITRGPVDLRAVFDNDRPVELEIGTGKGTFLLARASARPEVNFLGIEYAKPYAYYAADRFRRHGLTNTRMLHTEAGRFVRECLPTRSLLRMHILFPDPWPKRKHHRRRLIQLPFLAHATRTLRIGGQLIIVTDHREYFEHIRRVLVGAKGLARCPMPRMADAEGELVGTNFERKYIAQGRPFYAAARLRFA